MGKLKLFGYIFFVVSLTLFWKTIKNKQIIKTRAKKIKMTVVGIEMGLAGRPGRGFFGYHPVYEFEYNGETKTFVSSLFMIKPLNIGHQINMYYDEQTDTVIDTINQIAETTWAMMFAGLSIFMLSVL